MTCPRLVSLGSQDKDNLHVCTRMLATCSNLQPLNISTHFDTSQSLSLVFVERTWDSLGRAMEELGSRHHHPSRRHQGGPWGGHGKTMENCFCKSPAGNHAISYQCHRWAGNGEMNKLEQTPILEKVEITWDY